MAYFQKFKKDDPTGRPVAAAPGIAPAPGSAPIGLAPATPGAPAPGKGGFVNLSTYLGLNQDKGKEMAGTLAGGVTGELQKAKTAMDVGAAKFNDGIDRARNMGRAAPYSNVTQVQDFQQGVAALQPAADKAKQLAGGFDKRQGLVNDTFGKGSNTYTAGMGRFDNALAGAYEGGQFEKAGKLAEYLQGEAARNITGSQQAGQFYEDSRQTGLANRVAQNQAKQGNTVEQAARRREVEIEAAKAGKSVQEYLANNPGAQAYIETGDKSGWSGVGTLTER